MNTMIKEVVVVVVVVIINKVLLTLWCLITQLIHDRLKI